MQVSSLLKGGGGVSVKVVCFSFAIYCDESVAVILKEQVLKNALHCSYKENSLPPGLSCFFYSSKK